LFTIHVTDATTTQIYNLYLHDALPIMTNKNDEISTAKKKFIRLYKEPKIILRKINSSNIGAVNTGIMKNSGFIRVISMILSVFSEPSLIPSKFVSIVIAISCAPHAST